MDLTKITQRIQKFSDNRKWNSHHNPKNLVMALSGEVGELNEIFQWLDFEESLNLPEDVKQHTKEEIADIAIYLLRICMKLDIDIEDAIHMKVDKNEKKYPSEEVLKKQKKYLKTREK